MYLYQFTKNLPNKRSLFKYYITNYKYTWYCIGRRKVKRNHTTEYRALPHEKEIILNMTPMDTDTK
jgi:hypothetical protein